VTRTIPVSTNARRKDFSFYATKDRAMADEATVGLMLWDSESVGTLMNVLRLIRNHKKVVVYVAPAHEFVDVKTEDDWDQFLSRCAAPLRERIVKESLAEEGNARGSAQASLL
jgi:hypothetical protein